MLVIDVSISNKNLFAGRKMARAYSPDIVERTVLPYIVVEATVGQLITSSFFFEILQNYISPFSSYPVILHNTIFYNCNDTTIDEFKRAVKRCVHPN